MKYTEKYPVRLITDHEGEPYHNPSYVHAVVSEAGVNVTLCSGDVFLDSDGGGEHEIMPAGTPITCPYCLDKYNVLRFGFNWG